MATRKQRKRKRLKLPKGLLTVPQAAALIGMTPGGMYQLIQRGELAVKRRKPQIIVEAKAARAYRKSVIDYFKNKARIAAGRLTDEEFIQRMWDNDPD